MLWHGRQRCSGCPITDAYGYAAADRHANGYSATNCHADRHAKAHRHADGYSATNSFTNRYATADSNTHPCCSYRCRSRL